MGRSAHLRVCFGKVLPVWLAVLKHFMKKTKANSSGTKTAVLRLPCPANYNYGVNAAHRSSNQNKYRSALFKAMRCGSLKTDSLRFDTHQPEEVNIHGSIHIPEAGSRAAVFGIDTELHGAVVVRSEDAPGLLLADDDARRPRETVLDLRRECCHCCGGVNVDGGGGSEVEGCAAATHLEVIRRINQQADVITTSCNYASGDPTLISAGTSTTTEGSDVDEAHRYSTAMAAAKNRRDGVGAAASSVVSDSEGDYSYEFPSRSSTTIRSSSGTSSDGDHDPHGSPRSVRSGMRIGDGRKMWPEVEIVGENCCNSCSSTVTSGGGEDRRLVEIGGGGGGSCCSSDVSTVTSGGGDVSEESCGEAAPPNSAAVGGGAAGIMAVETDSEDPFFDFATSIAEMVIACGLTEEQQLEELFLNYLRLNPPLHHPTIALAFFHVLQQLAN